MTRMRSAGAMPSATRSSFTAAETAIRTRVVRASRLSTARNTAVRAAPKYPRSTWPWYVCTTWRMPARRAAERPSIPALAVCVWTMSGRSVRIMRYRLHSACASDHGRISRPRPGTCTQVTCLRAARSRMLPSRGASVPRAMVVV